MNNVKMISRKQADRIVDDLLDKYPSGPQCRFAKCHYEQNEKWVQRYNAYRKYVVLSSAAPGLDPEKAASFGYGDEMLTMVEHHIGSNTRSYVRTRYPDISSTAVSRRQNRLDDRVGSAVRRFRSGSGRGIYKVSNDSDVALYVIANTDTSACFLVKTILATAGFNTKRRTYASRVHVASAELLKGLTDQTVATAKRRQASYLREIEDRTSRAEKLTHLIESVLELGEIQPDLLSGDSDE